MVPDTSAPARAHLLTRLRSSLADTGRASLRNHAFVALAVYPALLLTKRGKVVADSKQLLFLDAGRMLARAPYLWDPSIGMGTVTHQNIGYLLPMGPWFWVTERLGLPIWLSQRLWLGTILFAAGAGVLFLARTLRWAGTGPLVAALAYALSPYVVQYATHLSVLLLPFAGLPWLVAFAIRACDGGWRWPAWFAIVVALTGSGNATALACVLVGPAIALLAELVTRRETRRQVVGAAFRISVLSLAVSIWWIVALAIEGRYAIDVLDFTESAATVTLASSAPEVLRGLGYWFFYGRDAVVPYLEGAKGYMTSWELPISFLPMLLAALAAVTIRWRRRGLFVALVVVGAVIAVGAHPYDHPSPYGGVFKSFLEGFDPARALRSITRITPVVTLGLAVLLGAGVTAYAARSRRLGHIAAGIAILAVVLSNAPLWRGQLVSGTRARPEHVPAYWLRATAALDAGSHDTRVLELPGIDFAAYTWGYAGDSITPGLMSRPTAAREVHPYGTPPSLDLLSALDGRLQDGVFDPAGLATMARLMSVGAVLVRGDLQYGRYGVPSPAAVWTEFDPAPPGLAAPVAYGGGDPPRLAVFQVSGARSIVRAEPANRPVILAGSGDGIVDAADAGALPRGRLIVYSGSLAHDPKQLRRLLAQRADLIVTDSNRRRAVRAKSISHTEGYTERAGEQPLRRDLEDARQDVFPGAGDAARSVTVVHGPTATATSYGNPVTLEPTERPMLAVDGDPSTAWITGDFFHVIGERLQIDLPTAVHANHVDLLQPTGGNRSITRVRLTFDGAKPIEANLDARSKTNPGQRVRFPARRFRRLDIEVVATDPGPRVDNGGLSGVGFAEVGIPGVRAAQELVRVPKDLLAEVGTASQGHALTVVLSRLSAPFAATTAPAEEQRLARIVDLPTARSFVLTGTARRAHGAAGFAGGCRDDLLRIDGRAVALHVADAAQGPTARHALVTCDGAPLALTAGRHVIEAADGRRTGDDVDQLVLRSAPSGASTDRAAPAGTTATPHIRVERHSATSLDMHVTGAHGPFWLVLGESNSKGWQAQWAGHDLGAPTLVDGYANGWYVNPGRATSFSVSVRWEPQRWVWVGLAMSALAIALCLVLALTHRRASRTDDRDPELRSPFDASGATPPNRVVVALVIGATAVAAVAIGPFAGVVIGVGAFVGLRLRHGRAALAVAGLAALGVSAAYITVREVFERFPADFPWPASFDSVHGLALVGVLLLAVDVVVERARARGAAHDGAEARRGTGRQ